MSLVSTCRIAKYGQLVRLKENLDTGLIINHIISKIYINYNSQLNIVQSCFMCNEIYLYRTTINDGRLEIKQFNIDRSLFIFCTF